MVSLITLISSGKGTWGHVNTLIKAQNWDKVYVLCNSFGYEKFEVSNPQKIIKLKFNENHPEEIIPKLSKFFKKEICDLQVAVNLTSGTGLEHMALLTAILKSGLALRFVHVKQGLFEEFDLLEEHFEEDPSY